MTVIEYIVTSEGRPSSESMKSSDIAWASASSWFCTATLIVNSCWFCRRRLAVESTKLQSIGRPPKANPIDSHTVYMLQSRQPLPKVSQRQIPDPITTSRTRISQNKRVIGDFHWTSFRLRLCYWFKSSPARLIRVSSVFRRFKQLRPPELVLSILGEFKPKSSDAVKDN